MTLSLSLKKKKKPHLGKDPKNYDTIFISFFNIMSLNSK